MALEDLLTTAGEQILILGTLMADYIEDPGFNLFNWVLLLGAIAWTYYDRLLDDLATQIPLSEMEQDLMNRIYRWFELSRLEKRQIHEDMSEKMIRVVRKQAPKVRKEFWKSKTRTEVLMRYRALKIVDHWERFPKNYER